MGARPSEGHKSAPNAHHAALAARQRGGDLVAPFLQLWQQRKNLREPLGFVLGRIRQICAHPQILHDAHAGKQKIALRHMHDAGGNDLVGAHPLDPAPGKGDAPLPWPHEP